MKKQLIIIGAGPSINTGINLGLWDKIRDSFSCGLNYSYRYFSSTYQVFVDRDFYIGNRKDLKKLPLIIGRDNNLFPCKLESNTLVLPTAKTFDRTLLSGVYKNGLAGIFSLSIGIHLIDNGEIFLLGYDYSDDKTLKDAQNRPWSHFYQGNIEHKGIGRAGHYNTPGKAERDFGEFRKEKKVKIYNVSLGSQIPGDIFPKISYSKFFKMLNKKQYNQVFLRGEICKKLKDLLN